MNKLKELRIKNGYSCQAMADKLKISKSFYWQLEQNQRRLSYETAFKLALIFKLKPDDIFYNEFKKTI